MTALFTLTILIEPDEEKRRSTQTVCDKTIDEIESLLKDFDFATAGFNRAEALALTWLLNNYANEECSCPGCLERYVEEEVLNGNAIGKALNSLREKGWVELIFPEDRPEKEAAN